MKKSIVLLFVGLLAAAAAFLWLDFHLARTSSSAEASNSTFSLGLEQGDVYPPGGQLAIFVEGEGIFAQAVAEGLKARLQSQFDEVTVVKELAGNTQGALLFVTFEDRKILWTPVYGRSLVGVNMAFTTDGDIAWLQDTSQVAVMKQSPSVRVDSSQSFTHSSLGLLSRPSYYRIAGEALAERLAEPLLNAFQTPAG